MTTQVSEPVFCPACDRSYSSLEKLQAHLEKARSDGDEIHIDVIDVEGWDEKPLEMD